MGRPAKPAGTGSGTVRKEELEARREAERRLKGKSVKLTPPKDLSDAQKKIYKRIIKLLEDADTLGELDAWILEQTVISIDRLQQINEQINADINKAFDKNVNSAINTNTKIFFRGCNELGLSPQARAKLGIIAAKKQQDDPLEEWMNV